jgi:hypothetical protein
MRSVRSKRWSRVGRTCGTIERVVILERTCGEIQPVVSGHDWSERVERSKVWPFEGGLREGLKVRSYVMPCSERWLR